jgi:hypothetical protein
MRYININKVSLYAQILKYCKSQKSSKDHVYVFRNLSWTMRGLQECIIAYNATALYIFKFLVCFMLLFTLRETIFVVLVSVAVFREAVTAENCSDRLITYNVINSLPFSIVYVMYTNSVFVLLLLLLLLKYCS